MTNPLDAADRPAGTAPPSANSYWVVPGRFAAGEHPGPTDLEREVRLVALLDAGVDYCIELTEAHEVPPYLGALRCLARRRGVVVHGVRRPIRDGGVPKTPAQMVQILDAIDAALDAGRTIYVHCFGGIGRTGTVVGCHLVRRGYRGGDALDHLAELWRGVKKVRYEPATPETDEQVAYVRRWREDRAGGRMGTMVGGKGDGGASRKRDRARA